MKISSTSKVVAAVVGFGLALSIFAAVGVVGANAQSMTATQLINLLVAAGVIPADKAAAALSAVGGSMTSTVSFSKDLTVGSTGADVTNLQNVLGVSPATGYFGSITKAAVVSYQGAHGIPTTGYVGPLTRGSLNGSATMTGGTTTGGTTTGGTVVNTGVEGTLTVDKASISNSTVYEGDTNHAVLGLKVQAKLSDINIQRIKLDLGASTSFYTKVFKSIAITDDAGTVLARADLNSNTVVKDSGEYYLTLGGFSYTVAKDTTKYLWVKADTYSSIKSEDYGNPRVISLAADGVRGVDGAGIDQYAPVSSYSQSVTISGSLSDSATLDASLNSANYKASDVIATDGAASDELDKVAFLAFDLRANKADVKVTDIKARFTASTGTHATTTTAYLYDGSTLLQSESIATDNTVTFEDIDNLVVGKDATKTLTIKADVREADSTATTISAAIIGIASENLQGDEVSALGTSVSNVSGENMIVRNIGAVYSLVGTPSMSRTAVASADAGLATSTGIASFTLNVTAKGGDIVFGSAASTTNIFGASNNSTTTTTFLAVYKNGAKQSSALSAITSQGTNAIISYSIPSSGVTTSGETFTLSKNNSVQIPVTVQFTIAGGSANTYAVQIEGLTWSNVSTGPQVSNFMADKSEWRTSSVSLP